MNAADVATNNKERRQKNDKIDARKLCEHLQTNKAKSIYILEIHWEHGRTLVRLREHIVSNQTRYKNRIWQLLHFSGVTLPEGYEAGQYWSKNFITRLEAIDCQTEALKMALSLYIRDYQQPRSLLLEATRSIRRLCTNPLYTKDLELLRSIPGIGEINAAIILFEL